MPKPTIVLVHGAWADGSSWNAVSTELQGQGFTVLTPPNLLHGVEETPPTSRTSSRSERPALSSWPAIRMAAW